MSLDFHDLVSALVKRELTSGQRPTLVGGRFAYDPIALVQFVNDWELGARDMPWCIWTHYSSLQLVKDKHEVPHPEYLLRGRIFGPGGDLDLWRDSESLCWRFVGPPKATCPKGYGSTDYWQSPDHANEVWLGTPKTCLLWGAYDERFKAWHEDRIGNALYYYPGAQPGERAMLEYKEYTCQGDVQAVWWLGIGPADNGRQP